MTEAASTVALGRVTRVDLLAVGVVAAAALSRLFAPLDPNTHWLIATARAVCNGARLDVDIVETNPPMAVWIHLPAVWLERWTGIAAEPIFGAMAFVLGVAAALHLAHRLEANGLGQRFDRPLILAAFLLCPLATFADRDPIALLLLAPMLGITLDRLGGRRPAIAAILMAGCTAGLATMIKPHFAAPVAALAVLCAWRARAPLRLLLPEAVLAAALSLAYAAAVYLYLPAYSNEVLPLLFDLYRTTRHSLPALFLEVKLAKLLLIALQLALLLSHRRFTDDFAVLLTAAAAFTIVYLDQGRGGAYQIYPALALIMIATLRLVPDAIVGANRSLRLVGAAAVAAIAWALPDYAHFFTPDARFIAAIRAAAPAPTVANIAIDLSPSLPITTAVEGRWVGTYSSRWITGSAALRQTTTADPSVHALSAAWAKHDRATLNRDLATRRPDIVLVGSDWHPWIAADAETARLMAGYRRLAVETREISGPLHRERMEAWIRRDLVTTPP